MNKELYFGQSRASSDANMYAAHVFFSTSLGTGNVSVREWPGLLTSTEWTCTDPQPSMSAVKISLYSSMHSAKNEY